MRWLSKCDWNLITWKGKKNNIKFEIKEYYKGFSTSKKIGYYILCESFKDDNIVLNSLWIRSIFKTLEETQQWCEELTQEELIKLREIGLNKYRQKSPAEG